MKLYLTIVNANLEVSRTETIIEGDRLSWIRSFLIEKGVQPHKRKGTRPSQDMNYLITLMMQLSQALSSKDVLVVPSIHKDNENFPINEEMEKKYAKEYFKDANQYYFQRYSRYFIKYREKHHWRN